MKTFWQDLSYGVRMLLKTPGLTVVALLTIALGIGANTAIFSVVNAVLLRPLPFAHAEQLVQLWGTNPKKGVNTNPISYLNFADLHNQSSSFENMVAYSQGDASLVSSDGSPEQIDGVLVSSEMFPMLGINPVIGRALNAADEKPGKTNVAVISDGLWRRRFGADPNIVGRVIMLGGDQTTIVGVMPKGVKFPLVADNLEFWTPLDSATDYNKERGGNYLSMAARLKPGVSLAQAQSELDALAQSLAQQYPDKNGGRGLRLATLHEAMVGSVRPALLVLLSAVLCVLLIACANVANLLLGRAVGRNKEIAVRMALGATRLRLVRQLLTESVVLAGAGGLLGMMLALWGMDLLSAWIPRNIPRGREIALDSRVLVFTIGISLLTGLVFGLAPALSASKLDINDSLKEGGRGSTEGGRRSNLRSILVVGEIALSLMLLVSAGLLIKSFDNLLHVAPGFRPEHTVTMSLAIPETKYKEEAAQVRFYQQVLQEISEVSGVSSVGAIDPLPLSNNMVQNTFSIEGRPTAAPEDRLITGTRIASPDYLKAMGIPLIKGRAFTLRDSKDAPKAILINETLAKKFFAGEDPIGKRMKLSIAPDFVGEIVGIVGDVKHRNLETEAGPECYVSLLQVPTTSMSLVVRTANEDPGLVIAPIREAVAKIDKDIPLADIRTMSELVSESVASRRFNMMLLGLFAAVALLLAAIGIFGVISHSVTQRTHEVGIRIALGAQTGNVLRLIVGQGMMLVVTGVGVGLLGSLAVTRVMTSLLYGVSTTDPFVFAGVALLLALVALLACFIPALRATKVDPIIALRYE